jgi:hypothetical protein
MFGGRFGGLKKPVWKTAWAALRMIFSSNQRAPDKKEERVSDKPTSEE